MNVLDLGLHPAIIVMNPLVEIVMSTDVFRLLDIFGVKLKSNAIVHGKPRVNDGCKIDGSWLFSFDSIVVLQKKQKAIKSQFEI